jgi:uncharacterized membrane protein
MITIRNPLEWGADQLKHAVEAAQSIGRAGHETRAHWGSPAPAIRRIAIADLKPVLEKGFADFAACRTDVVFLCVVYPVLGLILARIAFGERLLPLLFPLASGFALVGPFAGVGLYEMSRRREAGAAVGWVDAFGVVASPAIGAIVLLGLILMAIFLAWLGAAWAIYALTLGPASPASITDFARAVLTTERGWLMIVIGIGTGFLFALLVLAISVVSFPLLLDRAAGLDTAVRTSFRAVAANPAAMAAWGLVVAIGLAIGSLPLFVGLIVVLPVLGHATWHLYRRVVE